MKLTYSQAMIFASGNYLTDYFPKNWEELEEDELYEFIENATWGPLEGYPASQVFDAIENLAGDFLDIARIYCKDE